MAVDIFDHDGLVKAFSSGFDAIVIAYAPPLGNLSQLYRTLVEGHIRIKAALLDTTHTGPFIIIGNSIFARFFFDPC